MCFYCDVNVCSGECGCVVYVIVDYDYFVVCLGILNYCEFGCW